MMDDILRSSVPGVSGWVVDDIVPIGRSDFKSNLVYSTIILS